MKQIACSLLAIGVLTGCGGGSSNSVSFTTSPVQLFSDRSGVGSIQTTEDGTSLTGYIISPELAAVLQELESGEDEAPDAGDFGDSLPIVATTPTTVIREGAETLEGLTFNVLAVTTTEEDVGVVLLAEPISDFSFWITLGPAATEIPTSDIAIYNGTIGFGPRLDPSSLEIGTFTAEVDFSDATPTVQFDGSTTSYSATGSALVSGGSFSSSSLTILTPSGDVGGSLQGDFHDVGAADMAGVIYSNDSLGTYSGAFVGSQ